jgi:hypothetical protein
MARLLHDDDHRSDLCADLEDDCKSHDHHHEHHHHKLIPVGRISLDCTPVTFKTPGQAFNVVSCPVSEVVTVPVTQTVIRQVPIGFGCVANVPVTETVQTPVTTTVNLPPILRPVF